MNIAYKSITIIILLLFVTEVFYVNGLGVFFNADQETYLECAEDTKEGEDDIQKYNFDYKSIYASIIVPNVIEVRTLRYIQKSILYATPFIEISSPPPNFSC